MCFAMRFLLGLAVSVFLGSCLGEVVRVPVKPLGAGPLFQIRRGNQWGYMDRAGNVAILPRFADEGDFFEGLAKVQVSGRWGYINEKGEIVIPCLYERAGDFREGLAPVQKERKWGFIGTSGNFVIPPRFQAAAEFHEALAQFEIWETLHCPSARSRQRDIPYAKDAAPLWAYRLHDIPPNGVGGCAPIDGRYGFVRKDGSVAISARFTYAGNFSNGLAHVRTGEGSNRLGYIDTSGKMVIPPRFLNGNSFSDGLAAVVPEGPGPQRWGFIDREGNFSIPARFTQATSFSDGLAAVLLDGTGWIYVDRNGRQAIPVTYGSAAEFSDGLALVESIDSDGDYYDHYIDRNGRNVLKLKFAMWPFFDGFTIAGQIGEQNYIDRHGKVVAPYEADK